jgi:hypothetical protein
VLAIERPRYGAHYLAGDVFFTWTPGSFLTHNIGLESAAEAYEAGLAVPTHCGLITGPDELIEAQAPVVRRAPLAPLWASGRTFVVVRRPAGQTQAAVEASIALAEGLVGAAYDTWGLAGFTLSDSERRGEGPNFLENPEKWFCSELVAHVLRETAHLREGEGAKALRGRHPSWWTPWDLFSAEGFAEPGFFAERWPQR